MKNEKNLKPNSKHWVPLYGAYQMGKDLSKPWEKLRGKTMGNPLYITANAIYQGLCLSGIMLVAKSLEELLQ